MSKIVYVFDLLLDVFIVFTIFAIYLYMLFRYSIHTFEENGLAKFFKIHLEFYKPLFRLYKETSAYAQNPNEIPEYIEQKIDEVELHNDQTDYTIANYAIIGGILGLFLIVVVYFIIFRKLIMEHIKIRDVLIKIFVNAGFILMYELLFLYFVYGNTDLIVLYAILNTDANPQKTVQILNY